MGDEGNSPRTYHTQQATTAQDGWRAGAQGDASFFVLSKARLCDATSMTKIYAYKNILVVHNAVFGRMTFVTPSSLP